MGGYVALEIMRQAPERVAALALVGTSARPDAPATSEARRAAIAKSETAFDAVVQELVEKMLPPSRHGDGPLVDSVKAMAQAVGRAGFVRQQTAIIGRPDSRPLLAQIRCPTLVLCGREDRVLPLEMSEEMAAAIPGATLVVLDGTGHLSPLEQPERVTEALREWLTRVDDEPSHPRPQAEASKAETPQRPALPDRLSVDPRSPHHVAAVFEHPIGIRLNDHERHDVEEYCISEGWIKVAAGKTKNRAGQPLLIRLKGRVEAFYR
jgi:surfactin synthase thioesterase subunit